MARPQLHKTLNLDSPDQKREVVKFFSCAFGEYEINAEPRRYLKSHAQLRYYFGVVLQYLLDYLNQDEARRYTKEQVHEMVAMDFLPQVEIVDPQTGVILKAVRASVATLTKEDMTEFVDRVRIWMHKDIGVPTPDPDPNWRNHGGRNA